jgi:hypothetical protein
MFTNAHMHRDLARAREAEMMARAQRADLIRQAHRENTEPDEIRPGAYRRPVAWLARRFATS